MPKSGLSGHRHEARRLVQADPEALLRLPLSRHPLRLCDLIGR